MPNTQNKKTEHLKELRNATVQQVSTLVISAFGLVAALAWNTAIQAVFADLLGKQSGMDAMLAYAVTVTIIAVVVTIYLTRIAGKIAQKD